MRSMNGNLFDVLFSASSPEEGALRTETGATWSRGDLQALAGRLATVLRVAGVGVGDRIAVQVEKSPESLCLYLAGLMIGAVYLPINTAYTWSEADHILKDAEPVAFIGGLDMIEAVTGAPSWSGRIAATLDGPGGLLDQARDIQPLAAQPMEPPRSRFTFYTGRSLHRCLDRLDSGSGAAKMRREVEGRVPAVVHSGASQRLSALRD